ncbi:MAG: MarR family transcriptional regulator [Methanothrix sp.]|jgi:DNA-binding MarR family transcriptional regulator|nr:MarR family transcriptional regulator [Methanothrix sp.]
MSQFPTDKQLAALGFLAINEAGYSSIELAKLLKMDKSNFSRIVLKPLSGSGWIKVEKSPKTGYPGRPKEILKITKDISMLYGIIPVILKRIDECEIENMKVHKDASEHMDDVDFNPELWDILIEEKEASLEYFEHLGGIFYELQRNSISSLKRPPTEV